MSVVTHDSFLPRGIEPGDRIPNSVINIQDFINQFGEVDPVTGIATISPHVVSLWSGLQQVGIVSGQVIASGIVDRIGRK